MFKAIKENRAYENIVNQVKNAIFRGDLKPGDKLPPEHELAKLFGVSRVTVREAIRALEQCGVVTVRQGSLGGTFIQEADIDKILEQIEDALMMKNISIQNVTETRVGVEKIILELIIPKIEEKDIKKLEENIRKAEKYLREGKDKKRLFTNFDFHLYLSEKSQNPILILIHKLIVNMLISFFEDVKPSIFMANRTIETHRKLLEHFKKGNISEAVNLNTFHIKDVSSRIKEKSKNESAL